MSLVLNRRLTDRIRDLCTKVLDPIERQSDTTLRELQSAIQEHTLRLSNLSVAASLTGQLFEERRKMAELPIPAEIRRLVLVHLNDEAGFPPRKPRHRPFSEHKATSYRH